MVQLDLSRRKRWAMKLGWDRLQGRDGAYPPGSRTGAWGLVLGRQGERKSLPSEPWENTLTLLSNFVQVVYPL